MLKIPKEETSNASIRKYKQIYTTHLLMAECISSIELAGIMDIDIVTLVRVQDQNGNFVPSTYLFDPSSWRLWSHPRENTSSSWLPGQETGCLKELSQRASKRKGEATKNSKHVASAIIHHLIFLWRRTQTTSQSLSEPDSKPSRSKLWWSIPPTRWRQ